MICRRYINDFVFIKIMIDEMKFITVNETNHLFTIIVIKKILYDFTIYIFLNFGLTISTIISSITKTSSISAAFSIFKTFTTFKRIYNVLSRALITADAGMRLQRGRKWVTVQQGTDHVGTDWLCI